MGLNGCGRRSVACIILFALVASALPNTVKAQTSSSNIEATGVINYFPRVDVSINATRTIGVNNLSLGFMLDWEWQVWRDRSALR